MEYLTHTEAQRAMYVDFECLATSPWPAPALVGIAHGDGSFEQVILDAALATARVGCRRCRVADTSTVVEELVERSERDDRWIVGWSFFDRDVAMRANPALAVRMRARYRNALHTARPWRRSIHPSARIERADPYAPRHTLDKYAVLAAYRSARRLRGAAPARWIRHVIGQLAAHGGRYRETTAETRRDWHRLLEYNEHDCRSLRTIMLLASRELDAWRAYERTRYCFEDDGRRICFRIGSRSHRLEASLSRRGASRWAFLTAWNPGSVPLSRAENDRRQARLVRDVRGYDVMRGEGIGDDPAWEPEQSVMVLGISRAKAVALAAAYGQLAIVVGTRRIPPTLVPCSPTPRLA